MKTILSLVFILGTTSVWALDFECTRQVSTARVEGAEISSWPHLWVSTSFHECTKNEQISQCLSGPLESIATPSKVCYRDVDVNNDCTINEMDPAFEVVCKNGSTLKFEINAENLGQVSCSEHGKVRKTWNVGTCTKK